MMRTKRLRAIVANLVLTLSAMPFVTQATPAYAASTASNVSIYTFCASSSIKPVGMWYSADNGQRGWATWGASDPSQGAQWFTFHLNNTITNVNLSIGCGGAPQKWGKTMSGAIAVFKIPSQRFIANCSKPGYVCQLTYG